LKDMNENNARQAAARHGRPCWTHIEDLMADAPGRAAETGFFHPRTVSLGCGSFSLPHRDLRKPFTAHQPWGLRNRVG